MTLVIIHFSWNSRPPKYYINIRNYNILLRMNWSYLGTCKKKKVSSNQLSKKWDILERFGGILEVEWEVSGGWRTRKAEKPGVKDMRALGWSPYMHAEWNPNPFLNCSQRRSTWPPDACTLTARKWAPWYMGLLRLHTMKKGPLSKGNLVC